MHKYQSQLLQLCLLSTIFRVQFASAVDFLFNGFDSSDLSLDGNATVEFGVLTLTEGYGFHIGCAFYPSRVSTKSFALPFSTSFIFSMTRRACRFPGCSYRCRLFFSFVAPERVQGSSGAGLSNCASSRNPNNQIFGLEFRVSWNFQTDDVYKNHLSFHVISPNSVESPDETSFGNLVIDDWMNYQVWIDYSDGNVNVSVAPVRMERIERPKRPSLSASLNLSQVLEDEMFVGFAAFTDSVIHRISAWSFSNTNFSLSDGLVTDSMRSFELSKTPVHRRKGFIAGVTAGILSLVVVCFVVAFVFVRRARRTRGERVEMEEDWELEYWPHRLSYQEIDSATKNFAEENVIGVGGNGKVYRGVFPGGSEVAVKRISQENAEGIRAFFAEISSLGRVKHRSLVGLRGWCKRRKGGLFLVYDYMENGSLDKRVFDCDESKMLRCDDRIRILKQVASGILYLHEGWESKVLHRDIKASNVLLDGEMNARLGDFGLARMHDHDEAAGTTRVVGTIGYLAPEMVRSSRASTQTDVFGYGVLILEVMCGRRPIEEGKPPLVDWVWQLLRRGELLNAIDARLRASGDMNEEEVERVLHLGLLCAHPEPNARPTMREVVKLFEGKNETEEEGMELYLLQKLRSREIFSMYHQIVSPAIGSHPTFYMIRQGLSSSNALSCGITILEGR